MPAEQVAALLSLPGIGALVFIIIRQQVQIDKLVQANIDLVKQFMTLHPPADETERKGT